MQRTLRLAFVFLLLALAAAAVFAPPPPPAQAQDEEQYVDLWVEISVLSVNRNFEVHLGNEGNRAAHGVTVEIERTGPVFVWNAIGLPDGTCLKDDKDGDCLTVLTSGSITTANTLFWNIPLLAAGEELELSITSQSSSDKAARYGVAVTSASWEKETRRHDNSHHVWVSWDGGKTYLAEPSYSAEVRVDDRRPSAGDTVNFAVFAKNHNYGKDYGSIDDGCVNIRLTSGLTATGTPTLARQASDSFISDPATTTALSFAATTTRECGDKSGAAGFFLFDALDYLSIMTLPVTIASGAAVGEQCLTAEIFATPPTGSAHALDDPDDNRVTYCLEYPPVQAFDEGEVSTWAVHACKYGTGDDSCDTAAKVQVEVFAVVSDSGHTHGSTEDHTLTNATALIHIKDDYTDGGRVFDADDGSLTNGTTVSWMTRTDEDPDFTGSRNGVKLSFHRKPVNDYDGNWTNFNIRKTATGLDGGDPPGKLSVRSGTTGTAFWALTSANSYTSRRDTNYSVTSSNVFSRNVEFETLGTYVVEATAYMLHSSLNSTTTAPCRIDPNFTTKGCRFEGTGRTIFHVGPIAELGVADGGVSPHATTDQVAFTVLGINNRDEDAESGEIVVELPAGTTALATVPANTGTFDGTSSPPTWTWDIHDLPLAGSVNSPAPPDGVPVTLIVDGVSAGATSSAKVVYDAYEVCIGASTSTPAVPITLTATTTAACTAISGASWHSGTVFDYDDTNNAATLTARSGAAGPALASSAQGAVGVVRWSQVKLVNGQWVESYEVQRADSPGAWSAIATTTEISYYRDDYPGDTARSYRDATVQPGKSYDYRIRAVNGAGVAGPWSASVRVSAIEPEVRTETVTVRENPYARFPSGKVTRSVAENSPAGSAVGAPVAVVRSSGNNVLYSLEGADAALFDIERDSGQILVGQGTALDFESGRTSYSVEVVAGPSRSARVRTLVVISVTDVAETAEVTISPAGRPRVGQPLTATLSHGGGEPVAPRWQWQRTTDGTWAAIQGADEARYTPTRHDAGRRLRVIVTYGEPGGGGETLGAAAAVTLALAGEPAAGPAARYDANGDGRIDLGETLAAIADYFAGALDYDGVIEVIAAYYAG